MTISNPLFHFNFFVNMHILLNFITAADFVKGRGLGKLLSTKMRSFMCNIFFTLYEVGGPSKTGRGGGIGIGQMQIWGGGSGVGMIYIYVHTPPTSYFGLNFFFF